MNSLSYNRIEEFIDAKLLEFNERRTEALHQLSFESLFDSNPLLYIVQRNQTLAEMVDTLIDQKLLPIEEMLLENLMKEIDAFLREWRNIFGLNLTDVELRRIIDRIIFQAHVCGKFEEERGGIATLFFVQFYKHFCDDKSMIDWLKIANLNDSKYKLGGSIS